MRVLLTGGGTGGHVSPALAIAEKIIYSDRNSKILFIGRKNGRENQAVRDFGLDLCELEIYGLKRSFSISNIKSIFVALGAVKKAKKIIKEFSPDVIVGTGGYVCWPVLFAGRMLGIRTYIHESNACPGLVTRLVASGCEAVLLNHSEAAAKLKRTVKTVEVGNPIRQDFFRYNKTIARRRLGYSDNDLVILSFGGSGGAELLNDSCLGVMKEYSVSSRGVRHVHATGEKYYNRYKEAFPTTDRCYAVPYITDMPIMLSAADIVITRAGAMTLSEIAASASASILIPSPNVTDNHQYKNAKLLADCGAAVMIEERDLDKSMLIEKIRYLARCPDERKQMSKCIEKFAKKDSADRIYKIISSE